MVRRYTNTSNVHRRWQRVRRAHAVLLAVLALLVVAGAGIWWWFMRQQPVGQVSPAQEHSEIFAGTLYKTIGNEHFYFESKSSWEYVERDSVPGQKYVYHNIKNKVIDKVLTVYVGEVPADTKVSYILPVTVAETGQPVPGKLSPNCSELNPSPRKDPLPIVYEGVRFICVPDTQAVIIAAAQPGTGYSLHMGTGAAQKTVGLVYNDVSITPDPQVFTELVATFRVK